MTVRRRGIQAGRFVLVRCLAGTLAAMAILLPHAIGSAVGQMPPTAAVFELRVFTAAPGRLGRLQEFFGTRGDELLARHGIQRRFAGTILQGASSDGEQASHMLLDVLTHTSRGSAARAWAGVQAEPGWASDWAAAERDGPLLATAPVSTFMATTDFSPAWPQVGAMARAEPRVFELRRYNTGAEGLDYTVDRFRVGMAAILTDTGMRPVAYWTSDRGDSFIYMVAHETQQAAAASWMAFMTPYRAFMADYPRRPNAVPAPGRRTPEENRMLAPTKYSPLR